MVDACRKNDQISLYHSYSDPIVVKIPNIEEPFPVEYVSNLFIFVQMFAEEHLHFFVINSAHFFWRDDDLISVLIGALTSDVIDRSYIGAMIIENVKVGKNACANNSARVVVFTLVALRPVMQGL